MRSFAFCVLADDCALLADRETGTFCAVAVQQCAVAAVLAERILPIYANCVRKWGFRGLIAFDWIW